MRKNNYLIKSIFISVIILMAVSPVISGTDWVTEGWQIYKSAGDGRQIALGNAQTAAGIGAASVLFNPALDPASDNSLGVAYAHQSSFAGTVNHDLLAFPISIRNNEKIHLVILHQGISGIPNTQNGLLDWGLDGIPNTNDLGEGNGSLDDGERLDPDKIKLFNQTQFSITATRTYQMKNFRLGFGLKTLYHKLGAEYGLGFGLDIGMIKPLWTGAYLGLSFRDVTTSLQIWNNGRVERFKPSASVGFVQTVGLGFLPVKIKFMGDLVINELKKSLVDDYSIGDIGGNFRGGFEINYRSKLYLRFGRNENTLLTTGVGIAWDSIELNYGFIAEPTASSLGSSHLLSFAFDPDWLISVLNSYL